MPNEVGPLEVRGVPFGRVWNSSGARGFAGEGYWFHRLVPGLDYRGSTFVAKTATLESRPGNMQLDSLWRPVEWLPKCIVVRPFKGVALNSVGLSNPGVRALLDEWADALADHSDPWLISLMSVRGTAAERLKEIGDAVGVVSDRGLPGRAGLQLNLSCPNAGLDPSELVDEAAGYLDRAAILGLPTFLKVNALFPVEAVRRLAEHPRCDGFVCSNTIPWGKMPDIIDWRALFGTDVSPLAHLGGGGLSGAPLLPIVAGWILAVRAAGVLLPLVGGGGILRPADAELLLGAGADAVELGSISFLRPWRVRSVIRHVNGRFCL